MNSPLVSVIVPVYNVAPYLEQCLDSIVNQTYRNLEIILVDDGSTDESGAICDRYAEQDSRIKVVHKENGGQSSARNVALDMMTGEWVLFVDSDDWIELNTLELLFEQKDERADLVEFGVNLVYSNNIEVKLNKSCVESGLDALTTLVVKDLCMGLMCNKFIRASAIGHFRFAEGRYHEDTPFIMELLYNLKGYYQYISLPLYHYLRREGQTTDSFTSRRLDLYLNFEDLMEKYVGTAFVEFLKTCYVYWAKSHFFEIYIQPSGIRRERLKLIAPYLAKARKMTFIHNSKAQWAQWRVFQLMPSLYAFLVVHVQPLVKRLIGK